MSEVGYVYAIEAVGARLVKFGHSVDPSRRLKQLQCDWKEELRILAYSPLSRHAEYLIHRGMNKYRYDGEWYHMRGKLFELIGHLKSGDDVCFKVWSICGKVSGEWWCDACRSHHTCPGDVYFCRALWMGLQTLYTPEMVRSMDGATVSQPRYRRIIENLLQEIGEWEPEVEDATPTLEYAGNPSLQVSP